MKLRNVLERAQGLWGRLGVPGRAFVIAFVVGVVLGVLAQCSRSAQASPALPLKIQMPDGCYFRALQVEFYPDTNTLVVLSPDGASYHQWIYCSGLERAPPDYPV